MLGCLDIPLKLPRRFAENAGLSSKYFWEWGCRLEIGGDK